MDQIFANLISDVTGGLTIDLTTVISALVLLSLLVLGFAYIQRLLMPSRAEMMGELDDYRVMAHKHRGTALGDLHMRKYKRGLRHFEEKYGWGSNDY